MKDYLIYKGGKTWFEAVNLESDKMPLILTRPFRSPHHTITSAALVGGGKNPKPRRN